MTVIVAVVVALFTPTASQAASCGGPLSSNCYGLAYPGGKSFLQAHAQLRFNTLTTGGSTSQFINTDITGGKVTFSHAEWATVDGPGGRIDFQTVTNYVPPTWPGGASALIHLDFFAGDLNAAEARVVRAGAKKFDDQPNAEHCLVFADPAGHPFCLSTIDELG